MNTCHWNGSAKGPIAKGGWGFNIWQEYDTQSHEWKGVRYSPAGAAAAIANDSIKSRPAFDTSDASEMTNPNATDDDVFLALAKHVPALSSAVGGVMLWQDEGKSVDMNLNDEYNGVSRPNGWGRDLSGVHRDRWLHSDMKDMAYFYVYKLFDQLVQKGNLK